jgi:hypothetical protein
VLELADFEGTCKKNVPNNWRGIRSSATGILKHVISYQKSFLNFHIATKERKNLQDIYVLVMMERNGDGITGEVPIRKGILTETLHSSKIAINSYKCLSYGFEYHYNNSCRFYLSLRYNAKNNLCPVSNDCHDNTSDPKIKSIKQFS